MRLTFSLKPEFLAQYEGKPLPFGFDGLGEVVFYRTYSRLKEDGSQESWTDVCERVINGMYSIQKNHVTENNGIWNEDKAISSAEEAFDRLWHLKWSPPGRGLYQMGGNFVHDRIVPEALQNCGFISTENIAEEGGSIFSWFMEMLMLGIGVGFDTRGSGTLIVKGDLKEKPFRWHIIKDSREGWSEALADLVNSYFFGHVAPTFNYSEVRPSGTPIKGFGGVASGPKPLMNMLVSVREALESYKGKAIDSRLIADIFNHIGGCVVAGNVRRSAEIALGHPADETFLDLKNYDKNPERAAFGWASNNSIVVSPTHVNYESFAKRVVENGEPGFYWLDNVHNYARMNGVSDTKDNAAVGVNPCAEQPLRHKELCTLVELYPTRHDSLYDFLRSIKFAYLYGKTVALSNDLIRDPQSRKVMQENRRIGLSMTGIAQFVDERGIAELIDYCEEGYDEVQRYDRVYSRWLGVNRSVRTTSVKPSGTVSLLAGVTPGVHYPESAYYIRRIRLAADSPLLTSFVEAGYHIEPDVVSPRTMVVEFPICVGENIRSVREVSIHEQLQLAAIMQRHWADNSVSCTVSFDPSSVTVEELSVALQMYQSQLKAVSFLPFVENGAYAQMPYEAITKTKYESLTHGLGEMSIALGDQDRAQDRFCDGEACEIDWESLSVVQIN